LFDSWIVPSYISDMSEDIWHGDLAVSPLPRLLSNIWEKRLSGTLRIFRAGEQKTLCFSKGELVLAEGFFSVDNWQKRLMSSRILNALQAEDCLNYARQNGVSFSRALIEREILPAARLWEMLGDFWIEDILPVFDWTPASYTFEPGDDLAGDKIYTSVPTQKFILYGIRRMKNFGLIESGLPAETEYLQALAPAYSDHIKLDPHEKHILQILHQSPRLGELFALSQAGKKETQKVVFALIHLGLAGLAQAKSKPKGLVEPSSSGLEKMWSEFNDKCSYIYKYISKEIGPVALSVLEKALDDVRSRLSPPLQCIELGPDGRIEFKPFPLVSLNVFTGESRKNFTRILNEILVAEVLAVKKTLGNAHEAAVVRNLEKIGEPM
jgi:hypothetical protein